MSLFPLGTITFKGWIEINSQSLKLASLEEKYVAPQSTDWMGPWFKIMACSFMIVFIDSTTSIILFCCKDSDSLL